MQYTMAGKGKELDGGTGYSQNGGSEDAGGYSMNGGDSSNGGGMSYSMGAGKVDKGSGMDYTEANTKGKIDEDGYTMNGKK